MGRLKFFPAIVGLAVLLGGCAQGSLAANTTPTASKQSSDEAVDASLKNAASAAELNHDYKGAVQHLNTLYQRHNGDRDISIALARNLRFSGQAQAAADVMQSGLNRFTDDVDMLIELGKDYLAVDRVNLAVKYLEKAKTIAPTRWEPVATLAVAYDTQGFSDQAIEAYKRADALSPDNPAILNNMGLSQALSGHLNQALATLNHAADLPNATAQVRQNLALLLALKGKSADAARLTGHDMPADSAKSNIEILKALAAARKE
jgi:Flp pilus assembly protein TadD